MDFIVVERFLHSFEMNNSEVLLDYSVALSALLFLNFDVVLDLFPTHSVYPRMHTHISSLNQKARNILSKKRKKKRKEGKE